MRERFRLKSGKVYDQIADEYLSLTKCIKTLNEYDDTLESLSFVVQENVMLRKKLDQLQEEDHKEYKQKN